MKAKAGEKIGRENYVADIKGDDLGRGENSKKRVIREGRMGCIPQINSYLRSSPWGKQTSAARNLILAQEKTIKTCFSWKSIAEKEFH